MSQTYLDIQEAFTKKAESCVLVGFIHGDNTPTWGWGHTGPEVKVGQAISPAEAETYFKVDQAKADAELKQRCTPNALAKLDEHQKAALLDFVFNAGANPDWNIWKVVNGTVTGSVPDEFDRFIWVHSSGPSKPAVTSAGLKNRRAAEKTMWNTADMGTAVVVANAGGQTVSSATRELITPPTPDAPKSLAKTSLGLKIGQLIGGTSLTGLAAKVATPDHQNQLSGLHDTVVSHAGELGHFGPALVSVLGAGIVLLAGAQFLVHLKQQEDAKL